MKNTMILEKLKNLNMYYNHPSYILEQKLLHEIKMGSLEDAMQTVHQINESERATLAKSSTRSIKNSLIGSCTIFTRAIIDAGVNPEDAFDLSDVFIKHIEGLEKEAELQTFEYEMVTAFVKTVNQSRLFNFPYPISKVVTYIHEHVTSKLTVIDLADIAHTSPDYLSKIFHKEIGMTISQYVKKEKIEMAKQFLKYDNMKITDIAILLEYCNPAYFSNVFKAETGQTPAEYRRLTNQITENIY
jgi:YesN/AraC family two-component response regulator